MRHLFALLILLGVVNLGGGVALAQIEPTPSPSDEAGDPSQVSDDEVNRVARQLYCPICENVPLDVCETQACEDWKDEIRRRLATGQSDQQIIDYFASIYGERTLAKPRSWVIWALPVIGLGVAALIFAVLVRDWLRRQPATSTTAPPAAWSSSTPPGLSQEDAEYVARLERELREQ